MKLHKGVVWVEDNKPKGAVFRVLIPINREAYAHEQFAEDDSSARNPYGGIEVAEDESKVPDNMQEQLLFPVSVIPCYWPKIIRMSVGISANISNLISMCLKRRTG